MASLTPGTLNKLLQNLGNQDFKVAGEHRSALLQVIGIVPSLEDDPWKSRGYFLRVSDSLHSAYVCVSDEDAELILNDEIQLGQFIHVARLDSCSPVPLLKGLKPIPKRRPCVGEPKDLISSDFLSAKKVEVLKPKPKGKLHKAVENGEDSVRRLSLGNGKVRSVESRRLSFDSARRGWDTSPRSEKGGRGGAKDKSNDKLSRLESVVFNKVSPKSSLNFSSISPLKSKNIVVISPKHVPKPTHVKNSKSSDDDVIFPSDFSKVTITSKGSSNSIMLSNSLPSAVCDLGKETRSFRNVAFASAARALEEASIHESVLRCMSMFAEICESSRNNASDSIVERFLNLHESMDKSSKVMTQLINNIKASNSNKSSDFNSQLTIPNASLWVQAAVETDLSKFSLYTKGGEKVNSTNPEKHHFVVLENNDAPENQKRKPVAKGRCCLSNGKGTINAGQEKWSRGSGLRQTDILLRKLISCSRAWFLDYLEDGLSNGFGVKNRGEDEGSKVKVLGQLKRVNKWLDEAFRVDGSGDDERIRRLRTKIYRFLLDNVDSAASISRR